MKKIIIILLMTLLATATGLYFRPSYPLIGQLNWWNVLTNGYFVGSLEGAISKGFIEESFFYVMRFTAGGFVAGILLTMIAGKSKSKTKSSAKPKKK